LGSPEDRAIAAEIEAHIAKAPRVVILGHEHPDGDCVGSCIALCALLRAQRRRAEVVIAEPLPARYRFLHTADYVRREQPGCQVEAGLAMVLDATGPDRLGGLKLNRAHGSVIINIDHHVSNTRFGTLNWVSAEAAATGELIWRLAVACGWPAPPVALEGLYAALVTDTGQFAYSNTTPRVLRMAAELVEAGVDPEAMWRRLYLDKTPGELELEARARDSFEVWGGGRIACISLPHEDFAATRTTPAEAQEFPAIPRSLAGCELALFFYEVDGGKTTKVSIRSRREINACELAQRFGGGGHRQASGCRIALPLARAKRKFRPVAEDFVQRPR
jgi:phosphoesterase RecJ-like protein